MGAAQQFQPRRSIDTSNFQKEKKEEDRQQQINQMDA
jgi:hypothetical protein